MKMRNAFFGIALMTGVWIAPLSATQTPSLPPPDNPIAVPDLPDRPVDNGAEAPAPPRPRVVIRLNPEWEAAFAALGFRVDATGDVRRDSDGAVILNNLLKRANLEFKEGALMYASAALPFDAAHLGELLEGFLPFSELQHIDPMAAGRHLAAVGFPPAYDAHYLVNPNGRATFFGVALFKIVRDEPGIAAHISRQRFAAALVELKHAYAQAFQRTRPDLANIRLGRAVELLRRPLQRGEDRLELRPHVDLGTALSGHRAALTRELDAVGQANGELAYLERIRDSLRALDLLDSYRHARTSDLPPVNAEVPTAAAAPRESDPAIEHPGTEPPRRPAMPPIPTLPDLSRLAESMKTPLPPNTAMLPKILSALETVYGRALTTDEIRGLILSFPMGETIWRGMGEAIWTEIWRRGLTGRNVKVAVLDSGVAAHPDLEDSVRVRRSLLGLRGDDSVGNHGTHVAGIIHALAPEAQILSYQVLPRERQANEMDAPSGAERVQAIMAAIRKAVDDDGADIVNMSLGASHGSTGEDLVRLVESYARRGIIFVIAAGNHAGQGVDSPSIAPSAHTVGSVDISGRISAFTSYGSQFDRERRRMLIKRVYLAPGNNIQSTVVPRPAGDYDYDDMGGTSMATPYHAGRLAWLLQGLKTTGEALDPAAAARSIEEALLQAATPVARNEVPADAPPEQEFLVIDVVAACRHLGVCDRRM